MNYAEMSAFLFQAMFDQAAGFAGTYGLQGASYSDISNYMSANFGGLTLGSWNGTWAALNSGL